MPTAQANWFPRVMIGANTASLNPQIPSPVHRPSPVAIELADGIGFGIDGETLVIDDSLHEGTTSIVGHLEDGSYPQRDFKVTRNGNQTSIDGYYDWQDYTLRRGDSSLDVQCGDPDFSATVTEGASGPISAGKFPSQAYAVKTSGAKTQIQGLDEMHSATIIHDGGKLVIQGAVPERSFEITRTPNGFHISGQYRFQDFDVTRTADGFVIQGYYPQQRYAVHQALTEA